MKYPILEQYILQKELSLREFARGVEYNHLPCTGFLMGK